MVAAFAYSFSASAQSTMQGFPTPVTTNQVSGTINARPIGDARLTTYFYTFDAVQGDVFINILTKNFNGDFDVFVAQGLRPISKIVALSGFGEYETGRVLYLRKPERLLLRIQGRTPDDLPATFQIKFAGSFVALNENDVPQAPELPTVSRPERTVTARREDVSRTPHGTDDSKEKETANAVEAPEKDADETPKPVAEIPKVADRDVETPKPEIAKPRVISGDRTPARRDDTEDIVDAPRILNLVVEFFDGSRIETPMTDIRRFTVDGGRLIIVGRDGRPRRYSMNDVLKVAIQ
ncbi:hypothetical protein BH24ACI3_BH24ACI3_08760 [soil metagenome]